MTSIVLVEPARLAVRVELVVLVEEGASLASEPTDDEVVLDERAVCRGNAVIVEHPDRAVEELVHDADGVQRGTSSLVVRGVGEYDESVCSVAFDNMIVAVAVPRDAATDMNDPTAGQILSATRNWGQTQSFIMVLTLDNDGEDCHARR